MNGKGDKPRKFNKDSEAGYRANKFWDKKKLTKQRKEKWQTKYLT